MIFFFGRNNFWLENLDFTSRMFSQGTGVHKGAKRDEDEDKKPHPCNQGFVIRRHENQPLINKNPHGVREILTELKDFKMNLEKLLINPFRNYNEELTKIFWGNRHLKLKTYGKGRKDCEVKDGEEAERNYA